MLTKEQRQYIEDTLDELEAEMTPEFEAVLDAKIKEAKDRGKMTPEKRAAYNRHSVIMYNFKPGVHDEAK